MDELLTLSHATERDVDLLLVEELKCSPVFVRWFVERVAAIASVRLDYEQSSVVHSKRRTHNRREIDIALTLTGDAERSAVLLIENKLDTGEQYRQAESYREEAELLVTGGDTALALTVLICPSAYAAEHASFAAKFDATVDYEAVATFLASRARHSEGELAARLQHRQALLQQALLKARRGYEPVPVAAIEQFNSRYVELLRQHFPRLRPGPSMLKDGRPGESKTMIFAPDILPDWHFLPQMRIVHQLREGNANLCFYTWGDHFTSLAGPMGSALAGTSFRIVPSVNKRASGRSSLMIVAETPPIDNLQGFEAQHEVLLAGMQQVECLREWIWSNRAVVEQWARIAT